MLEPLPALTVTHLSDKRLESIVSKILRQGFRFETIQVGSDDKGVPSRCPLRWKDGEERSQEEKQRPRTWVNIKQRMYTVTNKKIESERNGRAEMPENKLGIHNLGTSAKQGPQIQRTQIGSDYRKDSPSLQNVRYVSTYVVRQGSANFVTSRSFFFEPMLSDHDGQVPLSHQCTVSTRIWSRTRATKRKHSKIT